MMCLQIHWSTTITISSTTSLPPSSSVSILAAKRFLPLLHKPNNGVGAIKLGNLKVVPQRQKESCNVGKPRKVLIWLSRIYLRTVPLMENCYWIGLTTLSGTWILFVNSTTKPSADDSSLPNIASIKLPMLKWLNQLVEVREVVTSSHLAILPSVAPLMVMLLLLQLVLSKPYKGIIKYFSLMSIWLRNAVRNASTSSIKSSIPSSSPIGKQNYKHSDELITLEFCIALPARFFGIVTTIRRTICARSLYNGRCIALDPLSSLVLQSNWLFILFYSNFLLTI